MQALTNQKAATVASELYLHLAGNYPCICFERYIYVSCIVLNFS